MWISRQILLVILGLCSGMAVAGGIFAFITMLGVIPRLAFRTNTAKNILLYENAIIWGGTFGNCWSLYGYRIPLMTPGVCVIGIFSGIFVGCLAMALAESLRVLPILIHRTHIESGFPYVVLALGLGKMTGTLFQFFYGG